MAVIVDLEFIAASCTGKEEFASFSLARRIARRRASKWDRDYRGEPYKCRVCHLWHIGPPKRKQDARRDQQRKADRYGEVRI
jgi:hypothetical protein